MSRIPASTNSSPNVCGTLRGCRGRFSCQPQMCHVPVCCGAFWRNPNGSFLLKSSVHLFISLALAMGTLCQPEKSGIVETTMKGLVQRLLKTLGRCGCVRAATSTDKEGQVRRERELGGQLPACSPFQLCFHAFQGRWLWLCGTPSAGNEHWVAPGDGEGLGSEPQRP